MGDSKDGSAPGHCHTYALMLSDGSAECERGAACPLRSLLDEDAQAFLDGHDRYIRFGAAT
jgi:hypothetical protein